MKNTFLLNIIKKIDQDQINSVGAELAYFLILSIFPFIIFLFNILSYTSISQESVIQQIIAVVPPETREMIGNIIRQIISSSSGTLLSVSLILMLWTGSLGISAMIRVINKAYGVEKKRSYLKMKGISMLFTVFLALLIVIVFSMLVFGNIIGNKIFGYFGIDKAFQNFWNITSKILPLVFMIFVFALLYKIAPTPQKNFRVKIKDTLPGAIFTTVGWIIASKFFALYVDNYANYSSTYGSLGGIIILMVWFYLLSITIMIGAEINGINMRKNL
ncbi:MAG: YihY/virulence factor BrkB family protein [Thermotogae bacterium]|nr:YihY/virulence factor BrkB family protein [Thermotogota bacterium]MCP5465195.1 YihY/virulence factor BrkB family protein [Thermotogota bacterium]